MSVVLILLTILLLICAIHFHLKLRSLSGEPQIYAEVEAELQQRAHGLLVRKDFIEAHCQSENSEERERWKNDLAQYMEDYEQRSLVRRKIHLGH